MAARSGALQLVESNGWDRGTEKLTVSELKRRKIEPPVI